MQPQLQPSATKPRLLIILNRFVIGGQAVDTIPLAWYLKNDFDILILYGEKEKDEIEPVFLLEKYPGLSLKKIKYLRRSINPINDVFAFISVLLTIVKFKAHIVHTHGAKSGVIGRVAAWLARVPVIIHTFHGHFFHSYFSKTISDLIASTERILGKITTAAIALSTTQKNELTEVYKILPSDKIKIIQLGFDFDPSNNSSSLRMAFRNKYGLQSNDVAIGIVGRIVAVKNHSFFIAVIKEILSQSLPGAPAFFIIGDGDLRKQAEQQLRQEDISFNYTAITHDSRVIFTSWITEMDVVMNGLDIVALTSLNEGTPVSIIEAQFFKKPVVSTNVGGVKDTMTDGLTGFLAEKNGFTAFSQKLRLLIENRELCEKMGEEGYRFVSQKFAKEKEIVVTKQFYFDLLAKKGYSF